MIFLFPGIPVPGNSRRCLISGHLISFTIHADASCSLEGENNHPYARRDDSPQSGRLLGWREADRAISDRQWRRDDRPPHAVRQLVTPPSSSPRFTFITVTADLWSVDLACSRCLFRQPTVSRPRFPCCLQQSLPNLHRPDDALQYLTSAYSHISFVLLSSLTVLKGFR